jgi:hypothetical protein
MSALDLFIFETKKIQLREKDITKVAKCMNQIEKLKVQLMYDTKVMEALSFQTKTPYVQFTMSRKILPPINTKSNQLEEFSVPVPEGEFIAVPSFEGGVVTGASEVDEANAAAANKLD